MSLKNILRGIGRKILGFKKESATPATGQQQKQITYQPKPSQAQGQELAVQEIKNPPIVLKKTKPLQMGDDTAPAFGSSTYDWAMKKGRGTYTADEWLDHFTSTRKENFTVFGKPSSRLVRGEKQFKYDSGPFQGKLVNISKEELYDTNLAAFDARGNLTGGLLAAAKKFGIKLNANEIGAMIKLNPVNRLRPVELGTPKGAQEAFDKSFDNLSTYIRGLKLKFRNDPDLTSNLDDALYQMGAMKNGELGRGVFSSLKNALRRAKARPDVREQDKSALRKFEADLNNTAQSLRGAKTRYRNERSYTLEGGKDYRETIMTLPDEIVTNSQPINKGGHFVDDIGNVNNIYHIRFDTRFTPDGKKAFFIHEIQSDVNQSIAKSLRGTGKAFDGKTRINPFQKDIELKLLLNERDKLITDLGEAIYENNQFKASTISNALAKTTKELKGMTSRTTGSNYYPLLEADSYGDHALKYLLQRAARENVDYVAVAPFDKLSFRQGYKAGNERFYGYASGKGVNKSGSAVMPNLMKKAARLYNSSAGPTKISLSDPAKPYKKVSYNDFKYPDTHKLKGKKIRNPYHTDAISEKDAQNHLGVIEESTKKEFTFIDASNPNLYFDAFAIKVNPLMRGTQKTYKSIGGLIVDIFKPMRYN